MYLQLPTYHVCLLLQVVQSASKGGATTASYAEETTAGEYDDFGPNAFLGIDEIQNDPEGFLCNC